MLRVKGRCVAGIDWQNASRYHAYVFVRSTSADVSPFSGNMSNDIPSWPRVQELLHDIMGRWERKEGRKGLPGIHDYEWATPADLAGDEAMGMKFIEPGVAAEETALIVSLRKGFGSIPRMPMGGPFIKADEIDEISRWIDAGMPE